MTDEIALVTGGSRGIGLAIARALAAAGHAVAICARDERELERARGELAAAGGRALGMVADLRDPSAPAHLLDATRRALGAPTILVNNAGTAPTARFEDTNDGIIEDVLDLHVRAPFRLIRALLPELRAHDRGTIVQIASTAGLRGFPFTAAYTLAKHAMVGMTRALETELRGSAVRAFAVCPGFVDTQMTRAAAKAIASRGRHDFAGAMRTMGAMNRVGRMQTADEVAEHVVALVRDHPAGCVLDLDAEPPQFVPS
jgi:NAD(P)-dependent dehydrogenase (short-subunit alcohol dehydrogenase family)